mgnify:CR=1 FL=1
MNIIEKEYNWAHELSTRQVTNLIILHHAAAKSCTASDVHNWHLNRGWAGIGYHFFVGKDGSVVRGRPLWAVGAHAESCNWRSVGICFEGDYQTEQDMPAAQLKAGQELVQYLKNKLGVNQVVGHRDVAVAGTSCPGQYFPFEAICTAITDNNTNTEEDIIMVATQMISNGDSGNAVRSMQGALIAQGYKCGSYGADGICGAATVAAIRACQAANGLTVDSICGPDTWGVLLKP